MKQLPFLNDAAASPRRPAIIVPVQATTPDETARQCRDIAATGVVDVIEWRIDPLIAQVSMKGSGENPGTSDSGSVEAGTTDSQKLAEAVLSLAINVTSAGLPVLITLRTGFEGGLAEVAEGTYYEILTAIITGVPRLSTEASGLSQRGEEARVALDVEIDRAGATKIIDQAHEHGIPVVASHHNFAETDSVASLLATFTRMSQAGVDVAKIAMMPQSLADVAKLLQATAEAEAALDCPVLGISMGQLGRTSRIMGADFGSCASFAQLGEPSAPGQIAVADLAGIFDRLYD